MDPRLPGQRTVEAIRPCLEDWLDRAKGGMSYHMTQVLTGHGCFGEYLGRIGKERTTRCHHCTHRCDTAQHTLQECPSWAEERTPLMTRLGGNLSLPNVVRAMTSNEEAWKEFSSFCSQVMPKKEEAEREREKAGRRGRRGRRQDDGDEESEESDEESGRGEPPPSHRGRLSRRSPPPDDLSGRGAWVRGLCLGGAAAPQPVSTSDTG